MTDVSDLYHPIILEHNRAPQNYASPASFTDEIEAYNPLCGDQFKIYLSCMKGKIDGIYFQGYGCAVSKAAISVLTNKIANTHFSMAVELLENYCLSVKGSSAMEDEVLRVFQIAQKYPGRDQCALLGAEALFNFLNRKISIQ